MYTILDSSSALKKMAVSENFDPAESMESSPSGRISDVALESSSGAGSVAADPSPTTRLKDPEIQPQPSLRSEEYRQLFRLLPEEILIQDFNCALQESFLLQGHMYVFDRYICFYSNLFGFETKKVIPFHEVTSVQRAKVAGIFPTAIEIMAGEKKYFFTSFLSRDEAFRLITEGWSQHGMQAKSNANMQLESSSQANGICIDEKVESFKNLKDELEPSERNKGISVSEDSKPPIEGEAKDIPVYSGVLDNVEEDTEAVPNIDSLSSRKAPGWVFENSDAPKVPQNYVKVAEAKFPLKVEEFFSLFFSDDAVYFVKSYHESCRDKEFKCSSWYIHNEFGHARDVSFQHPIKIYFGAKFGSCQEVQKFRVYRDSHLVLETSQVVRDVPYGDYFSVEGLWDVERDDNESNSCILRYLIGVAFSKKTMWKGKIEQSTLEEARDAFSIWRKSADELLKQKNVEEEAAGAAADPTPNVEAHCERLETSVEPLGRSQGESNVITSQRLPECRDVNQPVDDPLHRSRGSVSSLKESMVKFYTSMKSSQSQVPILLIITFGLILLLMQLSMVMLLSRPQQVQLIPQAEYMGSTYNTNERLPEMSNQLAKQVQHLEEEILMVGTLLEKMRQEHALLKAQLRELEHFSRQKIS